MSLLDWVYVTDEVFSEILYDEGFQTANLAYSAFQKNRPVFDLIANWGRIGRGALDGEPPERQTKRQSLINEGKREMALMILALVKCGAMTESERQEAIGAFKGVSELEGKERNELLDDEPA